MYKALNGWTKTKILDHIKTNFKGQSKAEDSVNCFYRKLDGKKCAVGMFIPDEKYKNTMETHSASFIIENYGLESFMPLEGEAMDVLQIVHDTSAASETLDKMIEWVQTRVEDAV